LTWPGRPANFHLIADLTEQLGGDTPWRLRYSNGPRQGDAQPHHTVPRIARNLVITDLSGAVDVAARQLPLRLSVTVKTTCEQVPRDVRPPCSSMPEEAGQPKSIDQSSPAKTALLEFDDQFPPDGTARRAGSRFHPMPSSMTTSATFRSGPRYYPCWGLDGGSDDREAFCNIHHSRRTPGPPREDRLFSHPRSRRLQCHHDGALDKFQSIFRINVSLELPPDRSGARRLFLGGGGLAWYLSAGTGPVFTTTVVHGRAKGCSPRLAGGAWPLLISSDETNPGPDMSDLPRTIRCSTSFMTRDVGSNYAKVHPLLISVRPETELADGVRVEFFRSRAQQGNP